MKLFSKDKDLILKITNLVLILILNIAVIALYSNIIEMTFTTRTYTYEEYVTISCYETTDEACKENYDNYVKILKEPNYYQTRSTLYSASSVIIAIGAIVLLNKRKGNK